MHIDVYYYCPYFIKEYLTYTQMKIPMGIISGINDDERAYHDMIEQRKILCEDLCLRER